MVVDGLYDVWGQFPEILEIAPESGVTKLFPSLEELRRIPYTPGDAREVTPHTPVMPSRFAHLDAGFLGAQLWMAAFGKPGGSPVDQSQA